MTFPQRQLDDLPALTTDQMREVDRLMIEEVGISLAQMMENAGSGMAELVITRHRGATVTVVAGSGGNGGGGLVAARHLANRGVGVSVTMGSDDPSPAAQSQLDIVRQMGIEVNDEPRAADVIVDALIGYSLAGDPRGRSAELIDWVNDSSSGVASLDVPSGVDATTGEAGRPAVGADATLTIAVPKQGLADSDLVGDLYLVDISVPKSVYRSIDVEVPEDLFSDGRVVRLV